MTRRGATGRERRSRSAIVVAATVLSLAAGCGDDNSSSAGPAEREAVVRALHALQDSFEDGDRRRLCTQMDTVARRQAGLVAHGQPDDCPRDVSEALEVIDAGSGLRGLRGAAVASTVVTGDRATATVALDSHGQVAVPLLRRQGRWRLGSFFGTPPPEAEATASAAATEPFPDAEGGITVADGSGAPCFPIFDDDYPQVSGGCALGAAGRVTLTIGTAFGHFEFGQCELSYRMLADGDGRSWTDSVDLSGPDNVNNGCSDVEACENAAGDPLPWKGRVSATRDGRFVHRMNVCLDTCIGYYTGPLTVMLSTDRRGWRATVENAGVGDSGLRFDGRLRFVPDDLELTRARQ